MAKHERYELMQMQSLSLESKIRMTEQRIKGWINTFGVDGVYVSFSGGKDSTVLLDIIRNRMGYDQIPAVFVDVPTQYPELKTFVQKKSNIEILKPKISFIQVCEKYGFPLISKEVSDTVHEAKRYFTRLSEKGIIPNFDELYQYCKENNIPTTVRTDMLFGNMLERKDGIETGKISHIYDKRKYKFFLDAPFDISGNCCKTMKKQPLHKYNKLTGRLPFTAQMADESELRRSQWLKYGCNMFEAKNPISNPMSFWTEQDILEYIVKYDIEICSVYGDIVEDYGKDIEGQMHLADYGLAKKNVKYKCTGCKRTGCMLCGFGAHLEKSPNRFEMLKETHPKMYALLDVVKNNGVTFREAIEWANEHGNINIRL